MRYLLLGIAVTLLSILAPVSLDAAQNTPATPGATPEPGFVSLFDGSEASFAAWDVVGVDGFALVDGVIVANPAGDDLGLLYYAPRTFGDFVLRLQVRIAQPDDNSGVYVRFRDPVLPLPESLLATPGAAATFLNRDSYAANPAYSAIDSGFEAQIDESAVGDPFDPSDDGLDQHRTGALYDVPIGTAPGEQTYQRGPALEPGSWHDLEIEVVGDTYTVRLDGQQTTTFTNVDPVRGLAPGEDATSGYIGVQSHPFGSGHVDFRTIRIHELSAPPSTPVP